MLGRFDGHEEWESWKPWCFRCSACLVMSMVVVAIGILGIEGIKEIKERNEWSSMTSDLDTEVDCVTTGNSEKDSREYRPAKDVDPNGCDGEPCPWEYIGWVEVKYSYAGFTDIVSKCYSHIKAKEYERSQSVVDKFLATYDQPHNTKFRCCLKPSEVTMPTEVRFCDWDTRDPQIGGASLIVSIVFLSVGALYGISYLVIRKYKLISQDHVGYEIDSVEMGEPTYD
eukprot:TRINITY_DN8259_c1_g1_i2.p1 TRINITY_DN8259_c1_g1~~TRINITY_DN8259_c1_g1_i2.p1  ORF type:complete len:227 (+),score=35.06 TRINITY_DN8259_c1_g1_i2:51-731(+)